MSFLSNILNQYKNRGSWGNYRDKTTFPFDLLTDKHHTMTAIYILIMNGTCLSLIMN